MMLEREEQKKEYIENTTVTLTLPSINPVLQESLFLGNIEQVKSLQATLFPICSKGKFRVQWIILESFYMYMENKQ